MYGDYERSFPSFSVMVFHFGAIGLNAGISGIIQSQPHKNVFNKFIKNGQSIKKLVLSDLFHCRRLYSDHKRA